MNLCRNLNDESALNALSYRDLTSIWTPQLLFMNALGALTTTVDELSVANVIKEGDTVLKGTDGATEGK